MSDWEQLLATVGTWQGHGIDHDDRPFHGELRLERLLDGRALGLRFTATGIDGALLHDEHGWITPDEQGRLGLWTLHTDAPGVTAHRVRHGAPAPDAERTVVFGAGDPTDTGQFRVEVAVDWFSDGSLGYRYAWGLPGGDFGPRSAVRLRRAEPA